MLDLAESLLKECEAVEELHHTLEVISLVWDRWGGWIKDLPQSALMSAAQRRARDAQRRDVGAERMEEVRTSLGLIVPPGGCVRAAALLEVGLKKGSRQGVRASFRLSC